MPLFIAGAIACWALFVWSLRNWKIVMPLALLGWLMEWLEQGKAMRAFEAITAYSPNWVLPSASTAIWILVALVLAGGVGVAVRRKAEERPNSSLPRAHRDPAISEGRLCQTKGRPQLAAVNGGLNPGHRGGVKPGQCG